MRTIYTITCIHVCTHPLLDCTDSACHGKELGPVDQVVSVNVLRLKKLVYIAFASKYPEILESRRQAFFLDAHSLDTRRLAMSGQLFSLDSGKLARSGHAFFLDSGKLASGVLVKYLLNNSSLRQKKPISIWERSLCDPSEVSQSGSQASP
jgi:hypothetical protein